MSDAARAGREIVDTLLAHGARRVVAAPGSRNTPLLLALADAARAGRVELTVRTDERSAGFWALGLARASGEPAAVVTTSGTAVGNLLPAVMEAHHAQIPLVVVSADRPAHLLDTGANQTTHQSHIFGGFVVARADVTDHPDAAAARRHQVARLLAAARGPVHLNARFGAPLVADAAGEPDPATRPAGEPDPTARPAGWIRHTAPRSPSVVELPAGPRTIVLAGDAGPELGDHARTASRGHPLLAEPSSNARRGHALSTARLLLASELADQVERVVVIGHPTLNRPQQRLLTRDDIEVVHIGPGEVPARATVVGDRVILPAPDAAWTRRWHDAEAALRPRLDALLADRWCGPTVAAVVAAAVGTGDLVAGSSNPIRDLDLAPVPRVGPRVWANRGLAGIDGLIATASGVAQVTGAATLLVGDISFAHDLTSLITGTLEERPNLRVVVANDGGGSIFHTLEQGAPAHAEHFDRVFGTPLNLSITDVAQAVGARFRRITEPDLLHAAVAAPITGLEIIEVPLRRDDRRALEERIAALVR